MGTWAVAKAKAQFSELIDTAREKGAQEITKNGRLVGVLVSPEDWEKKMRTPTQNARTMSEFSRARRWPVPVSTCGDRAPGRGDQAMKSDYNSHFGGSHGELGYCGFEGEGE